MIKWSAIARAVTSTLVLTVVLTVMGAPGARAEWCRNVKHFRWESTVVKRFPNPYSWTVDTIDDADRIIELDFVSNRFDDWVKVALPGYYGELVPLGWVKCWRLSRAYRCHERHY